MFAGLALFSSFLWGSSDFLGGKLSKRFPALAVTGASQAIGLFIGLAMLTLSSSWASPTLSLGGYFLSGLFAGIAGFVGLVSYYAGLSTGKMGVVAPITSLSAVIPLIYGLLKGERPSLIQIIGMAIALIGCFLASGPEVKAGLSLKPVALGGLTAVMFGIALVFMARGSVHGALLTMTSMRVFTVSICGMLACRYQSIGGLGRPEFRALAAIGAADFLANFFLGVSTTHGLVSIAMVLGSLFPVVTTLLAYRFLQERLHRLQYIGVVFAVAGVALISAG